MKEFAVLDRFEEMAIVGYDDGKIGSVRLLKDGEDNPILAAIWRYNTLRTAVATANVIIAPTGEEAEVKKYPTSWGSIYAAWMPGMRTWFVKGVAKPWPTAERDYVEGRA